MMSRAILAIIAVFSVTLAASHEARAQSGPSMGAIQSNAAGPGQPAPTQSAPTLPAGVKHIYAMEGDNSLIVYADPEGFDKVLELVDNITGSLDVMKTRFDEVEMDGYQQSKLGVKIDPDTPILKPADEEAVLDAWKSDKLTAATYPLRVVTRENTCTSIMLTDHKRQAKTEITYVPRVAKDGSLVVEFLEPVMMDADAPSGDTAVIALPGSENGTVRLLFFMQTDQGGR